MIKSVSEIQILFASCYLWSLDFIQMHNTLYVHMTKKGEVKLLREESGAMGMEGTMKEEGCVKMMLNMQYILVTQHGTPQTS